jgi:hypothetical protein
MAPDSLKEPKPQIHHNLSLSLIIRITPREKPFSNLLVAAHTSETQTHIPLFQATKVGYCYLGAQNLYCTNIRTCGILIPLE